MSTHLVRVGLLGAIGRFRSVDHRVFHRDSKVICRTERGMEVGYVVTHSPDSMEEVDGLLLREANQEDELISARLERFRDRAFEACSRMIAERGIQGTLIDVEHLFDGQNVYFYFLGEVTSELEALTGELAETYEAKVKFKKFAETLAKGCGPDCGTGVGCGDGNCSTCALTQACSQKSAM